LRFEHCLRRNNDPPFALTSAALGICEDTMSLFGKPKSKIPELDFSNAVSFYSNDTHVTSSDDEVALCFGVRPLPNDAPDAEVPVHRLYMTLYSAKRFLIALQMAVERHEATFGTVIEQRPSDSIVASELVAQAAYANFARVTGTPEELTVEFGTNPTPVPQQTTGRICVHSQVAMRFAVAKSLAQQLSGIVRDYESRHGDLELDISRRLR
jgi:hypothetical protein